MTNTRWLLALVGAFAAGVLVTMWLTRGTTSEVGGTAGSAPASDATAAPSPSVASGSSSPRARVEPPALHHVPSSGGTSDPAGSHASDLESLPTAPELNDQYPGLYEKYQEAREAAKASSIVRALRRCLADVPDAPESFSWDSIETLRYDGHDTLALADVRILPKTVADPALSDCIRSAILDSGLKIPVPTGVKMEDVVQVRNGGMLINDGPELTADDLATKVSEVNDELADPRLSPSKQTMLQDALALYQCYERTPPEQRRQCLR